MSTRRMNKHGRTGCKESPERHARRLRSRRDHEKAVHSQYHTTGELAAFLGVTERTVKRWQKDGKIPEPAKRTESGWALYSHEQVTAMLEIRKAKTRGKS